MSFFKKLNELRLAALGPHEEATLNSLETMAINAEELDKMKATPAWKQIDKKMKEELLARITELTADDPKVMTLLAILHTVETKSTKLILEEQIKNLFPE